MAGPDADERKGDPSMAGEKEARVRLPVAGLVIISLVYILYAWDRLVVPIELVELRKAFGLNLAAAGFLSTIFTFGIALTAIPAGFFVIRFGTRTSLVVAAVIFSLCIGYPPFASGLGHLTVTQIGSGIGEGLYNVALFSFLGGLSEKYRGTLTGIAASLFGIGIFSGPLVVAKILTLSGSWQAAFLIFAIAGLVGAALIGIALGRHDIGSDRTTGPITLERLRRVLVPRNIGVAVVMAVNGLGLYSFLGLFTTFLRTSHHMELASASAIVSLFGIGSIIGGSPAGYVADRIGRKLYLLMALIVCAIFAVSAYLAPSTPWLLAALCFVFGLGVNSVYANCYALIQDQVGKEDIPLGTGVLATIYFLMGAFSGYLLVQARDAFGWGWGSVAIYGVPYLIAAVVMIGLMAADRAAAETGRS